jgi:hypothetical protein
MKGLVEWLNVKALCSSPSITHTHTHTHTQIIIIHKTQANKKAYGNFYIHQFGNLNEMDYFLEEHNY